MSLIEMFEQLGKQLGQVAVAGFRSEVDGKLHGPSPYPAKAMREMAKMLVKPTDVMTAALRTHCIVPNCNRSASAKKMCNPHYTKARKFKIDLTSKIPARLLKLLGTDGRKVDLRLVETKPQKNAVTPKQKAKKLPKAKTIDGVLVTVAKSVRTKRSAKRSRKPTVGAPASMVNSVGQSAAPF